MFDEIHRVECGDTVAFVVLHAVLRGRAFGGIRIRDYPGEEAALDDAKRLARAMSRKVVMAGIEGGGGKAVMIAPRGDRAEAVRRLGAFIESLGGRYYCGSDLGFTRDDLATLAGETKYVACGDLGPWSARTVRACMDVVAAPNTVAIQGFGAIGRPLAELLRGSRVIAADLQPIAGVESVRAERIYDVPCDVFAPCAAGGVLDAETIPRLGCAAVCGGANNPLATDDDALRLRLRGITYVPDFIANSGATIKGASTAIGEEDRIEPRMAAVADTLREVLAAGGPSPHHDAIRIAEARIAALR